MNNREMGLAEQFADESLTEAELQELIGLVRTNPELADEIVGALLMVGIANSSKNRDERSVTLRERLKLAIPEGSVPGGTEKRIMSWVHRAKRRKRALWAAVPLAAAAGFTLAVGVWWFTTGRISTGKGQTLTLKFEGEDTVVAVSENTKLRVVGGSLAAGTTRNETLAKAGSKKVIQLKSGSITASVAKQTEGQSFVVKTSQAVATVKGTKFDMREDATGTWVNVKEGAVRLARKTDGQAVDVKAGEFAVAAEDWTLKPYTQGTEYVEGAVIFADDFSGTPDRWQLEKGSDRDYVGIRETPEQRRVLEIASKDWRQNASALPKFPPRVGMAGSELTITGDVVVVTEYSIRELAGSSDPHQRARVPYAYELPDYMLLERPSKPVVSLYAEPPVSPTTLPEPWRIRRVEFTAWKDDGGETWLDQKAFVEGRLVRHIRIAGEGRVLKFNIWNMKIWIARVEIRRLVKVP